MELFLHIEPILWAASLLAEGLVVFRLIREGLLGKYPLFTAFLTVDLICSLVAMQFDIKSPGYAQVFRVCTRILFVFRLGVAAELYERICEHFPGIGVFRIGMAVALITVAALAAVSTFRPNLAGRWAPLTSMVVVQRFQSEIFAGTLVLTWIFLRFVLSIHQPFRQNVLTHWSTVTIYFAASGTAHLAALLTAGGKWVYPINCAMLAAQSACFVAWFLWMRRAGEEMPAFRRLSLDQVRAVEEYNRELLETVTSLPDEISVRQAENRGTPRHRARIR
ncbi:MAG: hypothetical protein WBE37_11515 [Bryobacteraceae bacterium]